MKLMDLIIRNARILQDAKLIDVDIGVGGGAIVAVGPGLQADARQLDASCLIFSST